MSNCLIGVCFIIGSILMGCAETKKSAVHSSDSRAETTIPSKFKISFLSYGTGIDYRQKEILDSIINIHSKGCKIEFQQKNWGLEGEVDYCFLNTASSCFENFYKDVNKMLVIKERVVLSIENVCEKK